MQIQKIPLGKINPAPYNPRKDLKPDDPAYRQLVRSLDEFGCVQPLVWNKRTGNLVGGHQRYKVLVAQGVAETQVSVVDLSLPREKALNIALNKISGEWDEDRLAALLNELMTDADIDVEVTGFDLPEVEQLLASLHDDPAEDEDVFDVNAELNRGEPEITKPGDLIELGLHGEHRLLCGDATKSADVAKVMGEHRARLCHADPPYGVAYDRRNRPGVKKSAQCSPPTADAIINDDLSPKRYRSWFAKICVALNEALASGAAFYIWNSHHNFGMMHELLTTHGLRPSCVITWAKESFCPGYGDYNEQTEFCLYGWKSGVRHRWFGPKNASTLWQVRRDRTDLYRHPTQKALELAERAIRNSSKRGEIVFDPFLGSGTTLIAAARLGRRCFGMEIEPRYCDCIVRRYIALAGESAVNEAIVERYKVTGAEVGI